MKSFNFSQKANNLVFLSLFALTILASSLVNNSSNAFSGTGTGSIGDPYLISTCEELQSIDTDGQNNETDQKIYKLSEDIDCSATVGWNSGAGFNPITNFEGTFDGDNHTISGLHINRPGEDHIALFGQASGDSVIARTKLTSLSVVGRNYVAGLVGESNGHLLGISASGDVSGASTDYYFGVGGLIGRQGGSEGSVTKSSFTGTLSNTGPSTGGIIGFGGNIGTVSDVYTNAAITGRANTGGIVGYLFACCNSLSNAYAAGTVTGDLTGADSVGGLVGNYDDASSDNGVSNMFAAANMTGSSGAGGAFGRISSVDPTIISNIAYDQTMAGVSDCVTLSNASNFTCTAQNTDGLSPDYFFDKTNQPLASWDFVSTWVENNGGYPTLVDVGPLSGPEEVTNIAGTFPDSPDQLQLTFDEPSSLGSLPLREYEAEAVEENGDWNNPVQTTGDSLPILLLGNLELDTTYVVRVRAVTAYGASEWVEYTVTTQPPSTHEISTCEELEEIDENSYRLDTIFLSQDIDCSAIANFSPLSWEGDFGGTFDGNDFTISNLNIEVSNNAGLFSYTYGAELRDLNFSGGVIRSEYSSAGALAGDIQDTSVYNVHSDIDVQAFDDGYAGGLVGFAENGSSEFDMVLRNLSSSGNISGSDDVGGLIGELENDGGKSITLSSSYATGEVSGTIDEEGYTNFGGLIGDVESIVEDDDQDVLITIENTYATGNVSGPGSTGGLIGDIRAEQDGYDNATPRVELINSYASGNVTSLFATAGGLIGNVEQMYDQGEVISILNNFSVGTASAPSDTEVGGLIGYNEQGDSAAYIDNNYFDSSNVSNCTDEISAPINNCNGVNENLQPNYFKNNEENPPLNAWNFDLHWTTQTSGYPLLRTSIDLNGDEIPDDQQPNIAGYTSPFTGKTVAFDVGESCEVNVDDMVEEANLDVQDKNYEYENGLFDFEAECQTPGVTTTIRLYYYDVAKEGLEVRKFNPNTNTYFDIKGADLSQETINGSSVTVATYQITDGGELDMDGVVNGEISDPAGVGKPVSTLSILASTGASSSLLVVVALSSFVIAGTLSLKLINSRRREDLCND
jgi:hypothetical protein